MGGIVVGNAVSEFVQVGFAQHNRACTEKLVDNGSVTLGPIAGETWVPPDVGSSAVSRLSFRANGTPCRAPSDAPDARA